MDFSGNYIPYSRDFQRWESQSRRLKLISDIMEDYQDNVRRVVRLIGCELGISNNAFPSRRYGESSLTVDAWLDRFSQMATDTYSPETPQTYQSSVPPPRSRPNVRRGFVYTQLSEPRDDNSSVGITAEQIVNATRLIQYDSSMNESRCPITLDYFEEGEIILQINNCRHIFGQPALMEWFRRHNRCPVCRMSVLQNTSLQTEVNDASSSASSSAPINTLRETRASSGQEPLHIRRYTVEDASGSSQTASLLRGAIGEETEPNAINNIISSILNSVNGAMHTETGYYESEFELSANDLLNAYTELLRTRDM